MKKLLMVAVIAASITAQSRADTICLPPFMWGVANSAFQVEGQPADSDTARSFRLPHSTKDNSSPEIATDFWNRYDEDFYWANNLKSTAFRISIPWERIEPHKHEWVEAAFQHYEDMIVQMRARGLEPVVTLDHGPLPIWLANQGGTLSKEFPEDFAKYMYKTVKRLSGGRAHVKYWITFNEPSTYAEAEFIDKANTTAEKVKGGVNFIRSLSSMVKAHIEGARLVRTLPYHVDIGFAQDWQLFEPYHETGVHRVAESALSAVAASTYNNFFTDGVIKGKSVGVNPFHFDITGVKTVDFVGVNYYTRQIMKVGEGSLVDLTTGQGPKADNKMEIYPEGLEKVLLEANGEYHLPIMVTENGMADQDENDIRRQKLLVETIHAIDLARGFGVNVIGYLHWSLTDNFEWDSGMSEKYGLMKIEPGTLKRVPRRSYFTYKQIIEEHQTACVNVEKFEMRKFYLVPSFLKSN